jgi:hypothetical protein
MSTARRWRKTVVLKDLLSADDSDGTTRECAAGFARVLKRLPEHKTDYELQEVVVELEDIACEGSTGDDVFGGCSTLCEWFNAVLSNLYDWADAERIWIGGKPR